MATTSTFSLRKLIQTRLHQDDDAIADDDTASCHDDHNNPIKKRLTTWLAPGRRGSTSGTALGRSSPDLQRSPSPLNRGGATAQALPESNRQQAQDILCGVHPVADKHGVSAKMADPKRRTLNDVPSHSSLGRDDANQDQDYFGTGDGHGGSSSNKKRLRPKTFLASPTPSSIFDPVSPPMGFNEFNSATAPSDQEDNMDTTPETRPVPAINRKSLTRDLSEGVRQLIKETDQAFEGVGSSIANSGSLDIPRLSQDMSRSNPDLTNMAPEPLVVDKSSGRKDSTGPKAEVQLDVPPRRSSQRDAALKAEHRKSRSVPPPIQVRKASPPPGAGAASPRPMAPAPRSATHDINSNSHNKTPPLKPSNIIRKASEKHHHGPRRPSKSTRWAIPENVSDLLTGRNVFKRTDVDEILTHEDLEKLKREREEKKRKENEPKPTPPPKDDPPAAKVEQKVEEKIEEKFVEDKSEGAPAKDEKPTTPHNRGLSLHSKFSHKGQGSQASISSHPSRPSKPTIVHPDSPINEAHSSSDDRTSEDTKATSASEDEKPPVPRKNSTRRRPRADSTESEHSGNEADDDSEPEGLATVDLLGDGPSPLSGPQEPKFPAPPPKNPNRYSPPTKSLPAIPKTAQRAKRRKTTSGSLQGEENEKFFYLKSTPFSITSPCFRHGPISFAKSEIGRGAMMMDETLDWTAFQMAILGAGEFLPDMYDEGDSRYADELKDWFHEFNFETHGVLIPETWPPSPRSSSHSTVSSSGSAENEHPVKDNSGYDTTKFYRGNGLSKRWTMEGKPKDISVSTTSGHKRNVSTPDTRSPLIVDNEDGKVSPAHQEEAQMGFNLQGDLGDFLQWEAQHAYAGGYYGAH